MASEDMTDDKIRIFRSWKSNFDIGDIIKALEVYTDNELSGIGAHGFNGIWLRGRFREILRSDIFPEFGIESDEYLYLLNTLTERAARHNINVYLYVNEPAGMPVDEPFWEKYPGVKGAMVLLPHHDKNVEGDENFYALCTSTEEVKAFLRNSTCSLFKQVTGLAGLITITASERQSHCYSHIDCTQQYNQEAFSYFYPLEQMNCPNCKERHPSDIVAEVNNLMYQGIQDSGAAANMICWNWSWNLYEKNPFERIISKLDKNIIIMADYERGGKKTILGKERAIDEYSLSYIGPSERAQSTFKAAEKHDHRIMAKLQIGTTHELATVPNLPLLNNIWNRVSYLNEADASGSMACWNMGNMLSLNTFVVGWGLTGNKTQKTLKDHVLQYFNWMSDDQYSLLQKAWIVFEDAMDNYPFSMSFLYGGAINYALAYWLPPQQITKNKKLGRSWLMDERGTDFSDSFGEWSNEDIITALKMLAQKWEDGVKIYKQIFDSKADQHSKEEYASEFMAGCCFKSAYHVYSLYALCADWKPSYENEYLELCREELKNCQLTLSFLAWDKRLGFHCECQGYMFNEEMVRDKIKLLEDYCNQPCFSLQEGSH